MSKQKKTKQPPVLGRLLDTRFGWMELLDPGLVYEIKIKAKAQLREGR